ncbi:Hybrid histidine kinase [Minicystis rosea]|nr:Hybrid histidine kinase [Minicystis rosea]
MQGSSFETSSSRLVLVLDCDDETCRCLVEALGAGFTVVSASSGALPADGARPDLVVLGPGARGSVIRLRLDEGLGDVPMLLISEPGGREPRARLLGPMVQDYVEAPLSAPEVRVRAENLIRQKRARDLLRLSARSEATDLEQLAHEALRYREALEDALAEALRARDQSDRVSRTKTAFVRTIGHELSAPLSALREALPRLGADSPPARVVAASVDWIAELCKALLDHAGNDTMKANSEPPKRG